MPLIHTLGIKPAPWDWELARVGPEWGNYRDGLRLVIPAWDPTVPRNLISGYTPDPFGSGQSSIATEIGIATAHAANGAYRGPTSDPAVKGQFVDAATLLVLFKPNNATWTGWGTLFSISEVVGTQRLINIQRFATSSEVQFRMWIPNEEVVGGGVDYVDGEWNWAVLQYAGDGTLPITRVAMYDLTGNLLEEFSESTGALDTVDPPGKWDWGISAAETLQYGGELGLVYGWNRRLTDGEVAAILTDPFGLIRSVRSPVTTAPAPAGIPIFRRRRAA